MLAVIRQFGSEPFDEVQWASRLIFEFLPNELSGLSKDDFETPDGYMEYLSRIEPNQQVNSIWGQGSELLDYLVENDIIRKKSMTYGELTLESKLYSSLLNGPVLEEVLSLKETEVYYVDLEKLFGAHWSLVNHIKTLLEKIDSHQNRDMKNNNQ